MKCIKDEELRKLLAEKYNCDIKNIKFETVHKFSVDYDEMITYVNVEIKEKE